MTGPETNIDHRGEPAPDDTATAVVIGRAGSKGLPGKNTRLVGGRHVFAAPLLLAATHKLRPPCHPNGRQAPDLPAHDRSEDSCRHPV